MSEIGIKTEQLFSRYPEYLSELFCGSEYPWEIVPKIKSTVKDLIEKGIEGYIEYADGVLVAENVSIDESVTIIPPAVIGKGSELRKGAYLRGNVIVGERCVVGNSTELKNCILLDRVQVPHYNYVGDSVLGEHVHLGAGAICSNLKSGGTSVTVHANENAYPTGLRKLGAMLGDGVDVGCGSVLAPGCVIGKGTVVYPLTFVRGTIAEGHIVKSMDNIVDKQ